MLEQDDRFPMKDSEDGFYDPRFSLLDRRDRRKTRRLKRPKSKGKVTIYRGKQ